MGICKARLLSDLSGQTLCEREATSLDQRLCAFHSRQCQGYKKRNAELDELSKNPPAYIANSRKSLVVEEFQQVDTEDLLHELHDYLFRKYVLLERVIKARKLHHSHFYAVDMDYGHEKYLRKLQNEKHVIGKALERLGKRGAEIMYCQNEWLDWVKHCQEEEQIQNEIESKKVKLEALLFKRHQKEVEKHQRAMKAKENEKLEDKYLYEAYEQRLSNMSDEEQEEWDPMKDVFEYERDNYVDLIKFFLMLKDEDIVEPSSENANNTAEVPLTTLSKSAKKRAKKANAEVKKLDDLSRRNADGEGSNLVDMETKTQMRVRLRTPFDYQRPTGIYFDTDDSPAGVRAQTHVLPDDEIDQLLEEIAEVKHFLFCRQLLSHASLLPIALRSDSIEEFLANVNVTQEHLRDLCLRIERPKLQDVRDACADFIRQRGGDIQDEDDNDDETKEEETEEAEHVDSIPERYLMKLRGRRSIPDKYHTKREKATKKMKLGSKELLGEDVQDGVVDFGEVTEEKDYNRKRTYITICGRTMHHYPSEKALGRGGWYHFSIIAKDSSLFDVVELCRNWNEFFELNVLCLYRLFPAPKWMEFIGDILRQQLLQLGFIPFFLSDKAEKVTHYFQTGSRGTARRAHQVVEMRNFICGNIKRDDPVSRRFIQYLSMETWSLRALVRDRKTGKMLIQPPENELWLIREKKGWGRAAKNEFENLVEVGPDFIEKMDSIRRWRFGFDEYYDVYIWDATPGRSYYGLQKKLEEILYRAMRVRELKDMFSTCAPILKTITQDKETDRVRIIKPGEDVKSIWENLNITARAWRLKPGESMINQEDSLLEGYDPSLIYTEADEIEDSILFPEEGAGKIRDNVFKSERGVLEDFEHGPFFDMRRFAMDLDSDEELLDEDDSEGESEVGGSPDGEHRDVKDDNGDPDSDKINDGSGDEQDFVTQAEAALYHHFKTSTIGNKANPDYFLLTLRNIESANWIPKSVRENPADLMETMRMAMKRQKDYSFTNAAMEADFVRHIDRHKSKVFKQAWHHGDVSHNAFRRYAQLQLMITFMDNLIMNKLTPGPFELCKFMNMAPQFTEERRIVDDAFIAYASIALFYEAEAFHASPWGQIFKDLNSNLLRQEERAKDMKLLDRRSWRSNVTMPKEFWKDFDALLRENGKDVGGDVDNIYPMEWRKGMRPALIQLFKSGIICRHYGGNAAGIAIAARSPLSSAYDLYIDYRHGIPPPHAVSHLSDPTNLTPTYLLCTAQAFCFSHQNARFSILRMWSAPHFYPLMIAYNRRQEISFLDDRGRVWAWKFIPKDMPYSEWSVHHQLTLRLEPYRNVLKEDKVIVAKDLILVMGEDEREVRKLSEGVTWAVQTKPWRLEIDFWRSFINVSVEFLERLDKRWLD